VLEEVTVTAQRRTERLQDVPVAVTALSGSELIDRGVRQAGDIVDAVPNLLLNLPYGPEAQPTFTLRGVTTQDFNSSSRSRQPTTCRSWRIWAYCTASTWS